MSAPETLPEACSDLLLLAMEIQKPEVEIPDGEVLRERVKAQLGLLQDQAERLGFGRADIEDTRYALVAMIDELLQFSGWASKLGWEINPLQAELFGERSAGVGFFERLERVQERSRDVLEVYYLCLALGFRGRYRVQSDEELRRLLDHLARALGRAEGRLSPKGLRSGPAPARPRAFPWVAAAGGLLALSFAFAVLLFVLLDTAKNEAIDVIGVFGG